MKERMDGCKKIIRSNFVTVSVATTIIYVLFFILLLCSHKNHLIIYHLNYLSTKLYFYLHKLFQFLSKIHVQQQFSLATPILFSKYL